MKTIVYDGFDFVQNGLVLTNISTGPPGRSLQLEPRAESDGSALVQARYGPKNLLVEGYHIAQSIVAAEQMVDTLNATLNRFKRRLTWEFAGQQRDFTATPGNWSVQQPNGLNRITFSIEFSIPEGFGQALEITTLFSVVLTASEATLPVNAEGSVEVKPQITYTIDSLTGGAGGNVVVRNGSDQTGFLVSRDWTAGDQMTVDVATGQLRVNGELLRPQGRLPVWQPGSGSAYYSDTFSSREITITATYRKRFF